MAFPNSLFAGVTGIQIHQTMLDVVGNNLANANTNGFKVQRVDFQDLFYQQLAAASGSSASFGGTNPKQVGFGGIVGSVATNFSEGLMQTTGRDLDVAITGKGFFAVSDGLQNFFTRAGTFDLDAQGFIIDSGTGFRLQRLGSLGEGTPTTPAFQTPGNTGIEIPFGTGITGFPTENVELRGNISATLTTGQTTVTAIQVFDTQGSQHTLTLTFTKTATPNTLTLTGTISGGVLTGLPTTVTFDQNGLITGPGAGTPPAGPSTIALNFDFDPPASATQAVTLNLGTIGQADGISQFGQATTVSAVSQDGSESGVLASFSIDASGIVQGIFTNGRILPLAQIGLATFANEGGLNRMGENLFGQSANSGVPLFDSPLIAGRGSLQSGALEGSNVDVALEFTRLIIAQRGFQINARTVTVSNEVLQELASIVR